MENNLNLYKINISLGKILCGKAYLGGEDIQISTKNFKEFKPSYVSLLVNANPGGEQGTQFGSNQQRDNLRPLNRQALLINIGT